METPTPNDLKSIKVGELVDLQYITRPNFKRALITEVTESGFTVHRPYCHDNLETGAEKVYFNWTDNVLNYVYRVLD